MTARNDAVPNGPNSPNGTRAERRIPAPIFVGEEPALDFRMTLREADLILSALGKLPLEHALELFARLREKGQERMLQHNEMLQETERKARMTAEGTEGVWDKGRRRAAQASDEKVSSEPPGDGGA